MKSSYPKISVIIPTFNEEENIKSCLTAVFSQDYPKDKLEVIVVDDKSTDKTLKIARKFPVKILTSGARHGEVGKMIGFKKATGRYAMYLDADMRLKGKKWFQRMLQPLRDNSEITGSFTRYYSKSHFPAIERFLSFDPLQRDSIYQFFSTSISEVIKEAKRGYFVCQYQKAKIPPAGGCLYKRKRLLKLVSDYDMFLDLDFLVILTSHGYDKFAYVPGAGVYHHHAVSIGELVEKRKYNLEKVYLGRKKRLYKWFDLKNPKDLLKIVLWIFYANLFIPSVFVGIYKSVKNKDFAGMYEPVVNFLITNTLIISFLKNKKGREFIRKAIL